MAMYPWQAQAYEVCERAWRNKRLPHALMIAGVPGVGRHAFALRLAKLMNCQNEVSAPCGHCHTCLAIDASQYPDYHVVKPAADKSAIAIDDVRTMIETLSASAWGAGTKVAVIDTAEQLSLASSNALLKLTEEPPKDTYLLFLTADTDLIVQTLVSRCQVIHLKATSEETLAYVAKSMSASPDSQAVAVSSMLHPGAPLNVESLANDASKLDTWQNFIKHLCLLADKRIDPLAIIDKLSSQSTQQVLIVWQQILANFIAAKLAGKALHPWLEPLAKHKFRIALCYSLWDMLCQARAQMVKGITRNNSLLWADCLTMWYRIFA